VDGLRADWVQLMPFVASLGELQPLETEFGYSITCHASIYTGASPQEHGLWFVWLRNEERSLFPDWLARVPTAIDSIPSRLVLQKLLVRRFDNEKRPRGYFGVPRLVNVPMACWPGLWVSEERFWVEDGYVPGYPTLFELARARDLEHLIVGMSRGHGHLEAVEGSTLKSDVAAEWYFLFIGEVDHAAHVTGGRGPEFVDLLRRVDQAVARWCALVEDAHGDFDVVLFSDHGHMPVEKRVDLYDRLPREVLHGIPYIVDTNFARFWSGASRRTDRLMAELSKKIPEGWILSQEEMRRWECWFPDSRYGDIIFYLDQPAIFARTAWGFARSQRSTHGYLPTYDAMKGVFVSTLASNDVRGLRDLFMLHQERLGLTGSEGRGSEDGRAHVTGATCSRAGCGRRRE
jgi:Type I phosphodiesterase / nucleotide pyrophosphatase